VSITGAALTWHVRVQRREVESELLEIVPTLTAPVPVGAVELRDTVDVPDAERYAQDLGALHSLVKAQGIRINSIQYRTEAKPQLGLRLRYVDLRLVQEYPRFKAFMSAVLAKFPHGALQEVAFERGDLKSIQLSITMKIVLVYRIEPSLGAPSVATKS
jgi:hypothetical protein